MFKKITWTIVFVGSFLPLPLSAADGVLTLDQAVSQVLAANPDIQAAKYLSAAAKARIPQARALDDPMVGVMFDDVPIRTADINRSEEIDYRIEQRLPFPGKRYVRGKAARHDARSVEEESQAAIGDVILDLKRTYYDLFRIERALEVIRQNQRLLKQFLGSTETRYATGQTTADSPLKAQVELSKLKNQEIQLDQERISHLSHLKALLNQPAHQEIRLPTRVELPRLKSGLEKLIAAALEKRPELKALQAMRKRDEAKLTQAKQGLLPDLSLGFQYGQRPAGGDTWTGTAMVNLPLFFWGKNRGEIREAKANLKTTSAMHQSMEIHTTHEIERAYNAVRAAEKLVRSYQTGLLPQAKTTLESARLSYAANKIDFMTLIDAARTLKDIQMAFYEVQAQRGTAFAELERLVGTNLEDL